MTRSFRWTKIDETQLEDHYYLTNEDNCIFLGDYNAGDGYKETTDQAINSTIHNLKKLKNDPNVRYRDNAISFCVRAMSVLNSEWVRSVTWVPIPPSKQKNNPEYNPKMLDILQSITSHGEIDVRELVYQTQSTRASHQSETRVSIDELSAVYEIDETYSLPTPQKIVLLDDVLTTGTHFKAMQQLLAKRFPSSEVYGMFFARRVPKEIDPFEGLEDIGDLEF